MPEQEKRRRPIRFSLWGILVTLTFACVVFAAMRDEFWVLVLIAPPISFLSTSVVMVFVAAFMCDVRLAWNSASWQPIRSWLGAWWLVTLIVAAPIVLRLASEVFLDRLQHPPDREIIAWISRCFSVAGALAALWYIVDPAFLSAGTSRTDDPTTADAEPAPRT